MGFASNPDVCVGLLSACGARWGRPRRVDSMRDAEEAHPRFVDESAEVPLPPESDVEEYWRVCRDGGMSLWRGEHPRCK